MKKITINNGEIRNGYEFNDLSEDAKDKVLSDHIIFEIDMIDEDSPYYQLALEMERMQTPWFLASEIYHNHKNDLIEDITINKYLFDEDGDILPIMYQMKGNQIESVTFNKHKCILT